MQLFSTMLLHPLKAGGHALYVHLTACQAHQLIQPVEIVSARRRTQPLSACRGQKHLRCSTASFVASANQRPPFTEQKVSVDSAVWSTMSPALMIANVQCSPGSATTTTTESINTMPAQVMYTGRFIVSDGEPAFGLPFSHDQSATVLLHVTLKKKHIAVFVSSDCTHRT